MSGILSAGFCSAGSDACGAGKTSPATICTPNGSLSQDAAFLEWLDDVVLFHRKGPSSCIASHMALPLLDHLRSSLQLAWEDALQVRLGRKCHTLQGPEACRSATGCLDDFMLHCLLASCCLDACEPGGLGRSTLFLIAVQRLASFSAETCCKTVTSPQARS